MLSLYGNQKLINDIACAAMATGHGLSDASWQGLKTAHRTTLSVIHPALPQNPNLDLTDLPADVDAACAKAFQSKELLDDLDQSQLLADPYEQDERRQRSQKVRDAIRYLEGRAPLHRAALDLLVHSIAVRPSRLVNGKKSFGGSTSGAMGVVWLAMPDPCDPRDVAELLAHELTHQSLFLEELVKPQFDYVEMIKPENLATSAILKRPRPMDKVVHSIVVSTEVLLFRQRVGHGESGTTFHPPSDKMAAATLAAIESVRALPSRSRIITPTVEAHLDASERAIRGLRLAEPALEPLAELDF